MNVERVAVRSALMVALVLATSGDAVPPEPPPASRGRTYVIVHGAWGGSWAFRQVAELLAARGHTVFRPSLTGLGERVHLATRDVDLSTHVQDVGNTILFEGLRDVVLVGHSYGGMVISGVADKYPDRIARLVYLDAFLPEDGESVMKLGEINGRSTWIKDMISGDFLVPAWVKPDQAIPKDVPQPLKTFTQAIVLKNPAARRIPATYILTVDPGAQAQDDNFAFCAERAKARGWTVERMEADHNPQRSAPEALVARLDAIH